MARVTAAEVGEIIEVDAAISLAPFISLASLLVVEKLEPQGTLSTARLKEIERWLAAHFYCIRDARVSSEGVAGISQSYSRGSLGTRLESTAYGQQAIVLDETGTLESMNSSAAATSVGWVGEVL